GGEEEECRALAAESGERVILHGRVSQQELAELLGRSHLFVLPSLYEGLPPGPARGPGLRLPHRHHQSSGMSGALCGGEE
ncbi:glycosyltransferase, partial [bacterium]|nr:glycosyltransferase [bacterium]